MRKVAIVAGGEGCPAQFLRDRIDSSAWIVAADQGAAHVLEASLVPNEVIGDFDSLLPSALATLVERGIPVIRHPVHKDQSDLELALLHSMAADVTDIEVFCALGGRLDHLLTNTAVLLLARRRGIPCRMVSPDTEVFYVLETSIVRGAVGDIVTLLATSDVVTEVWTEGLRYPLAGERLTRGSSRGLSNELVAPEARVQAGDGDLLVVHIRGSRP